MSAVKSVFAVYVWLCLMSHNVKGDEFNMITVDQAIEIARKEFEKQGYSPSEYKIAPDRQVEDQTYWTIWFELDTAFPLPGGSHAVRVDRRTGNAVFLQGE